MKLPISMLIVETQYSEYTYLLMIIYLTTEKQWFIKNAYVFVSTSVVVDIYQG